MIAVVKGRCTRRTNRVEAKNKHHLLWPCRNWNQGSIKALRMHPYCIVEIPVDTMHRQIHEGMPAVPVPSQANAKDALEHIRYLEALGGIKLDDPIEKRLQILIALFDCSEQQTADALRRQLRIVRELCKEPPS